MKASDIITLLESRHSKDVFVPECKDGPTWGANHLRLDAWAMRRSWSNPCVYGYEIKVSRLDFLQDEKWPGYLDLCNDFYFVCPFGLILKTEIPEQAGLMYVFKNQNGLRVAKKAPRRDVQIPEEMFRYILMSRSIIVSEDGVKTTSEKRKETVEYWGKWLADKNHSAILGRSISKELHHRVYEKIEEVQRENNRLEAQNQRLENVRQVLAEIGVTDLSTWFERSAIDQIKEAQEAVPPSLIAAMEKALESLKKFSS